MNIKKTIYYSDNSPSSYFTKFVENDDDWEISLERWFNEKGGILRISKGSQNITFEIGKIFIKRINEFAEDIKTGGKISDNKAKRGESR